MVEERLHRQVHQNAAMRETVTNNLYCVFRWGGRRLEGEFGFSFGICTFGPKVKAKISKWRVVAVPKKRPRSVATGEGLVG